MDYFRTDCIKSYFEIVALVNKGNRVVNEQTEAVFFIKDNKLFLGVNDQRKFCLCYKDHFWLPEKEFGHFELKSFIIKQLNKRIFDDSEINRLIKENLFKLSD